MTDQPQSNYWLDVAAREIIKRYPKGEIVVSSGISPSASYHIGHYREIMTADALAWAVRKLGRKAAHIHVVDNFDPLRKWYDFLPPTDQDYAGWPVSLVPDPMGDCHASYADHFYAEFETSLAPMGIGGDGFRIVKSYEDLYKPGYMTPYIEAALSKNDEIKHVFESQFNRKLPPDWTAVSVLSENRFEKADLGSWDPKAKTINGVNYENGSAKLDWRLDWPARWAYLGVNVEPFGFQEHGAAGGSYDTGAIFARQIFGVEPPYGDVRYGHIHRPGENVKISSSKGNVITPAQTLEIMPAEIFRYFIVRSRPEKKLFFDSGMGLANLIDEFAAAQADPHHEFRDAYEFAVDGATELVVASAPFKHLVQVYQAAQSDEKRIVDILDRTGWKPANDGEMAVLKKELKFVKNWLAKYAPDEIKFEIQQKLPGTELTDTQAAFLTMLADTIEAEKGDIEGQTMHELIYAAGDEVDLSPKEAFQALYRVILGKDSGPKAGWFLSSLDKKWLTDRLRRLS